jgi:hypothetical protein
MWRCGTIAGVHETEHGAATTEALRMEQSNNAMQLTKVRAAPERQDKVPPCAPAGQTGGGTASQLIASVRRTIARGQRS